MSVVLGIDLGTSSVKAVLLDCEKGVVGIVACGYDVSIPHIGYAEHDPDMWWEAAKTALNKLKEKNKDAFSRIRAVGFAGQMHALVAVDSNKKPVRPAIIWLDQRSDKQVTEIKRKIPEDEIRRISHNEPFTGFAFPSLLWLKENERESYDKIHKIFLPKDYIRLKMTGEVGTDVSDASATSCFDIARRDWSSGFFETMGLRTDVLLKCHESSEIAGTVTEECAKETGLKAGIPVVYGGADMQCQCIGNGLYKEGSVLSIIGTGGQVLSYLDNDIFDPKMRTHTLCHAINRAYTIFGAALCSGLSLKWLKNNVLRRDSFEELSLAAANIPAGSEGLIFLPHLTGERTPYMNPKARGVFFGLVLKHDAAHMARAVMEGVIYSMKCTLEIFDGLGIKSDRMIASGGAAASPAWLQIQADIYEKPVFVSKVQEKAGLGAAILAALGSGIIKSIEDASHLFELDDKVYLPDNGNAGLYREGYGVFRELYKRNVDLFEKLH